MSRAKELRTPSESTLFAISFALSLVAWLAVVITIVGLIYGLFIGLFLFIAHALMIAHIKGNGVKITEAQFPDLHRRVVEAARKLGLEKVPDAYVLQSEGALNAFATKFVGRNFLVVFSSLLEACDENEKEIDMILGHEIGHLALGHLRWIWFLIPARVMPWLGPAYSRACEYSCDLCGYEAAGDFGAAARGIAILAAGGKYGRQVNLDAYVKQAADTSGFWTSVYELNSSHPYLPKRIAALVNHKNPGTVPETGRHPLAYPVAPMFNLAAGGGPAVLVMVMMIAVLAAIAIPQYSKFRERAEQAQMNATLDSLSAAATAYREANDAWPCSVEEMDAPDLSTTAQQKGWELAVNCESALGAVIYKKDGKKVYRAVYFESGEKEDGEL